MKRWNAVVAVAALLAAGPGALAQTPPAAAGKTEYSTWSRFKAGTLVKYQTDSTAGGQATKMVMTTRLVEITPAKAVLETQITLNVMGRDVTQPAGRRELKADEPLPKAPSAAERAKMPKPTPGEDTVTVAGRSFKCSTADTETEQDGMTIKAKIWSSDDVPGSLVKMVSHMSGPMSGDTTMALIEFKPGS